jgi:polyisoprenyl-teichoic acid--peptidoglycan teichoic acid transferase
VRPVGTFRAQGIRTASLTASLAILLVTLAVAMPAAREGKAADQVLAGLARTWFRDRPFFVLVLGSDARPGVPVTGARSDVMLLVGVSPKRGRATVLGIHRDTFVRIPGHGSNKINAALRFGGPRLSVRTVESVTGIDINAYVLTSFGGLTRMVDAVGGIDVDVPFPIYDVFSRASLEPGLQRLDGTQALAFTRARHNVPEAVYGRTRNQGRLVLAAQRQLRRESRSDESRPGLWADIGSDHILTDLTLRQMSALASMAAAMDPSKANFVLTPARRGQVGTMSVVFLRPRAARLFADMRADGVISPSR